MWSFVLSWWLKSIDLTRFEQIDGAFSRLFLCLLMIAKITSRSWQMFQQPNNRFETENLASVVALGTGNRPVFLYEIRSGSPLCSGYKSALNLAEHLVPPETIFILPRSNEAHLSFCVYFLARFNLFDLGTALIQLIHIIWKKIAYGPYVYVCREVLCRSPGFVIPCWIEAFVFSPVECSRTPSPSSLVGSSSQAETPATAQLLEREP